MLVTVQMEDYELLDMLLDRLAYWVERTIETSMNKCIKTTLIQDVLKLENLM